MLLVTPYFMAALAAVAKTNAVTTISANFASRYARAFRLVMKSPPFGDVKLVSTLVCSGVRAHDPLLVWLRTLVRAVAEESNASPSLEVRHGAADR